MPPTSDRPRLRRGLAAEPDQDDPRFMVVWDEYGVSPHRERLTRLEFACVEMLFDGQRTLHEIQAEVVQQLGEDLVPFESFRTLAERFDHALFLDGPRFREHWARQAVREPTNTHSYSPADLRRQIEKLFVGPGGPGLPCRRADSDHLRAVLVPHMDYQRGNVTYGWGFKELAEQTAARLFVIVGTSHYSPDRFTLTRKDFKTPLGIVRTDQAFIDRIVAHYGGGLFDDELAHVPEHSIELEVAILQYVRPADPFRIVPLLVGSSADCVLSGTSPKQQPDIERMIEALRRAEAETPEPICYVISGDLAHIGPKFGDQEPACEPLLERSRQRDQHILQQAEAADPDAYFRVIAEEGDQRRICGLPPTYVVLEAFRPTRGRPLHYQQFIHPSGKESVSFASMAFYR